MVAGLDDLKPSDGVISWLRISWEELSDGVIIAATPFDLY
jgi:hypothetical protein